MSHTLHASCAEALSLAQSRKEDLAFLLDPNTGFAPKLRQICQETLAEARLEGSQFTAEEINALHLESDTWGLLQSLIP
jgi:nuclear pore complex protein Nup107